MNGDSENQSGKNLNQRIEDLVGEMEKLSAVAEKRFSYKAALLRGIAQGLGIVIGSTIVAGILYATLSRFINPNFIKSYTFQEQVQSK